MRFAYVAFALVVLGWLCVTPPARGQDSVSTELVALVISARECGPCNHAAYKRAVQRMKVLLAQQATRRRETFAAVGVGLDWDVDTARAYFATLGRFDELMLGRNWRNTGALVYIWRDSTAVPAMPQVVLVRRHVDQPRSSTRMIVSPDTVLARFVGEDSVVAWVAKGAPVVNR